MTTPNNYLNDLREDFIIAQLEKRTNNIWLGNEPYRNSKYQNLSAKIIVVMFILFIIMVGLILVQASQNGMFDSLYNFSLFDWLNSLPSLVTPNY